ncbi:tobamovirus multiplication protein 1-like isoform x1 [Anaeramoeba ignava]|uniref:Tobamovirus multiplication protein 1-like isoform x1 n=1 Tax=Anaeramoeba ignava TaxID=1746090 RepID=A0A9Q0L5J5_ANAIG|nr:tobamovirus multiplication protein 1-like isoform x1 [Anaeramoeba ignava]
MVKAEFWVEISFYSVLFVFLFIQIIRLKIYREIQLFYNLQLKFHVLSIIFAIARIIVTFLENFLKARKLEIFIVKRIAYLSFFTSFTLLLFGLQHNDKTPNSVKIPLVITNIVFYLFTLISIFIFSTHIQEPDYSSKFYQVNSSIVAAAFFIVSISFMIYGIVLIRKFKKMFQTLLNRKRYLKKTTFLSLFISLCFLLKFAVFLCYPITQKKFNDMLFIFIGYVIPELIPAFIQSIIMGPKSQKVMEPIEMHLLETEIQHNNQIN